MAQKKPLPRSERFGLFVERLNAAQSADDFESARALLEKVMNAVEDEFSGVAFNPDNWRFDGRFYPPDDDREAKDNIASRRKYAARRHDIFFGDNGSILIMPRRHGGDMPIVDKSGKDGRLCPR